jgi:hypothetical protein
LDADFSIEADMPVVIHEKILPEIAHGVKANDHLFQPGAWYYAGRLMHG